MALQLPLAIHAYKQGGSYVIALARQLRPLLYILIELTQCLQQAVHLLTSTCCVVWGMFPDTEKVLELGSCILLHIYDQGIDYLVRITGTCD